MQKEDIAPESTRRFASDLWQFLRPYRKELRQAAVWTVAMQLLALVEPYLLMFIIDDVMRHGVEARPRVLPMAAAAFILLIFTTGAKMLKDKRIRTVHTKIRSELPGRALDKLLRLPLAYHHGTNAGETLSKTQEGVDRTSDITGMLFYELFPILVQAVIVVGALCAFHWSIALIVFVANAASWASIIHIRRKMLENRRERSRIWHLSHRWFSESMANVLTVQGYGREQREVDRVNHERAKWKELYERELRVYDIAFFWRNTGINLVRVGIVALSAWFVFGGVLSIGQIVFVSMLVERLLNANFQLGGMYERFTDAIEPVCTLAEVMREPEPQADPEHPIAIPNGPVTLSLMDVTYAYPSRPNMAVLSDLTLLVRPGTMIGIIGESGHGKSTLAKLLLRYYDPTVGTVALNGVDLRKARKADFRSRIGYVPQEVELFDDTLMENIRYGAPSATQEEVERAAKLARADLFIERTELGYQTLIGDRGLRLSGGERQRIGIARAVITGAPILIFDEATSSVDPETIFEIKRAMNSLREDRTLIVISHQLSTVQDADLIVVLKDGRVSGMGTHVELMRTNETYMGFVRRQQNADSALLVSADPRNVS